MTSAWRMRRIAVLVWSVGVWFALPAAAEPVSLDVTGAALGDPRIERARAHFRRGVEFYRQGDFRLALVEFRRSHELSKHHDILYNIGQVNHQLNNYADALRALREYLSRGGERVSDTRRAEVLVSISELERRVARIHFRFNVADAELTIDDRLIGRVARQYTMNVDPGDHRIELYRRGYRLLRRAVSVTAGDTAEAVLVLERQPEAKSPRQSVERSTSGWVYAGWIATSAFAIGAGTTGVLAWLEADKLADQRNSPASTPAERESVADRARLFATTSDALAAATLVAGLSSLYLTLTDSSEPEAAPPRASAKLSLGVSGLTLSARY